MHIIFSFLHIHFTRINVIQFSYSNKQVVKRDVYQSAKQQSTFRARQKVW